MKLPSRPIFQQTRPRRLTRKGRFLLGSFIMTIGLTIIQFFIDESKKKEQDDIVKEQHKNDSIKEAQHAKELLSQITNGKNETIEKLA